MKAKRILAAVLLLALMATAFTAIPAQATSVPEIVTIAASNPVILADAGETINLSLYAVEFGGAAVSAIDWSDGEKTITTFKPEAKGVTKLIASSKGENKDIFVVAKAPAETEYVLYENDFSSGSWADLEKEGWKNVTGGTITVSDGALHIDAKTIDIQQTLLPDWFDTFGDYTITAKVTETNVRDTSRWCSIIYRCGEKYTSSGKRYYPFYHMCVRANTTSSTIEFAERTSSDGWNVITNKSYTLNMTQPGVYHELTVKAFKNTVQYLVDGEQVFYTDTATSHATGVIGFGTNYGIMNIDSVKVTVQAEKPIRPTVKPELVNTSLNRTESNVANYVSNHAFTTPEALDEVLGASVLPAGAVIDLYGKTVTATQLGEMLTKCAEKNVIAEFCFDKTAQVDLLATALDSTKVPEAVVISADPAVVKAARNKKKTVIRALLDYTAETSARDVYALYEKAAGAYAQGVLLPYGLATKETVAAFQIYELAVWACGTGISSDESAAWLIASGANAVVSDNPALIAEVQTTVFSKKNSITRTPVWTAHRGYFASVPENSMAAFKAGYENGADQLECDIHLTSDGVLVICHDGTIDRTFNGTGSIANMTYEQLLKYRLKNSSGKVTDEVIPTFEQLLQYCKDKDVKILCELKSSQAKLAPDAIAMIKRYGMEDQVMFISFSETQLTKAKQYLNVSTGDLNGTAGGGDASEIEAILNSYKECQTRALSYHSTLALNYSGITPEFIRDANDRGLTIWSWTYSSSTVSQVCTNFLSGMNGMTTNGITTLKNTVKKITAPKTIYVENGKTASYKLTSTTYGRVTADVTKNAELIVLDNHGVVEFGKDGTVKGLQDGGQATFMLSYTTKLPNSTEYTLYTQPITVVVGEIPTLLLQDTSSYELEGDLVTNVPEKTAKADFLSNFAGSESIKLYDESGKEITSDKALIGTGAKVVYGSIEATVIVKGDVNGDGAVDAFDYQMLKCCVLKTLEFNELQQKASNVNDDTSIDAFDYQIVKAHVLGNYNLYE